MINLTAEAGSTFTSGRCALSPHELGAGAARLSDGLVVSNGMELNSTLDNNGFG